MKAKLIPVKGLPDAPERRGSVKRQIAEEIQLQLNRRSLAAAVLILLTRRGWARPEQAFDLATADGDIVRNFRIASGKSPANLPGVILNGPAGADLVLYEFFDYACPYCRIASQDLDVLLTPGSGVRLGLVQYPFLSQRSIEVARLVLAAARRYGDFAAYRLHVSMFETPGKTSEEKALAVAAAQGLDTAALNREANHADISEILVTHTERARALSLTQTPSFVLGDFAFVGWPGAEATDSYFSAMRRCGGLRCPAPG
jgi:protein-disulfide isomerase